MSRLALTFALSGLLAMPAFAQYPAGTAGDDRGSPPSSMGNPTPQEEVKTHTDEQGRTVTEDGRPVVNPQRHEDGSTDSTRHADPGGPKDSSTDAGKLE